MQRFRFSRRFGLRDSDSDMQICRKAIPPHLKDTRQFVAKLLKAGESAEAGGNWQTHLQTHWQTLNEFRFRDSDSDIQIQIQSFRFRFNFRDADSDEKVQIQIQRFRFRR